MFNNKGRFFLSGIPKEITKNDLIDYFKIFSNILSCEITFDQSNNNSFGFGFMIISDPSKIPNIILTQPHLIKGHEIYCQEFLPKNFPFYFKNFSNGNYNISKKKYHDNHNRKIFIGGLPPETTKEDLINFFKRYGEIDYCIINTDIVTEKPRGFGFINFQSPFSVNYCLKDSNNHYIHGKWVECKKAKPSNGRKKHFIEKISYPTYEIQKDNIRIKNNHHTLRGLNNNNYYEEAAYLNGNQRLQSNLFVYQDNENNQSDNNSDGIDKDKNFGNNKKKDNEINSDKKLQNFKNDLKGKFNTMNDEQNLMEIDTNSSSSNTNINNNYNKNEKNSIFQKIKLNFNQNQKKLNNEKYIEENYKVPFINSNNFHNKKTDIKIDNKKSLSYSMLPNNEKQNPNNDLDNWDLSKNIPNTTKEMFQNYFNNLKDPQSYNYFHYKLFDVNGEEISNLSSYQNITKINLFKNEESSKSDKDSGSDSNSNSNNSNKNKSSSSSQKTKNNNSSSSNNKTISKNSNSDSNNSNKSNSHHSNNSRDGSDSNSLKNSGSNSDSNSGSGKNSNSNQNSGSDSNQNSKESKTPSNNYKHSKKHHNKSKSDSFVSSYSDLINYNKDSE